ncbi:hypothetical protein D2V93_14640 [Flagellimonas taeanensis]|jgi:hypothetical protein|uniref:Membrane domain of glycerophosphoryl diester phosphodiesterase n=1 Tax=Flagellimonas taeanensis TaxID=1005926 RepID=A0A1M6P7J0_9FLAO|nr:MULTISPECIES: hypothetical protein [Allomuricauda]MDC6384980.1 hypothetical protein [Muricauda sp. SK9]RIV49047.1 hypothetical protein D2V93_14640 [Allomuricauda taeanensis]SFB66392.1 hypothetical protein SAMN04487891_10162 [Allomuricauda taeanensis]SHK03888.1 hypothetical protein SAMN05216293_0063 [Allomuricauda taeanensis]
MDFTHVSQRINESGPTEFGSVFNRSVELFKKVWLQGFLTLLLTLLTMIPFYILIYAPMLAMGISDPEAFEHNEMPPAFAGIMILVMPIFSVGVMVIGLCLNAAFLRICRKYDMDEMGRDDYFFYFKKPYLVKALVLSLLMFGLSLLGLLACGLGIIYLMVPMSLFPAFFAFDRELTALEIVKSGFALGNKNWLIIFALVFVAGLVAQLGVILCLVGVFFTAMFSKIPIYYIYKDAIGLSMDA